MSSQMHYIAVNGKSFANTHKGGALRASLNIVNALEELYNNNAQDKQLELLIPTAKPVLHSDLLQREHIKIKFFVTPFYKYALFRNLWEQLILPFYLKRHTKYKILLNLTNSLPFFLTQSIPQVLLIHDVGFLNRNWFRYAFSQYLSLLIKRALQNRMVDIVTVSNSSAQDLLKTFPEILVPKVIYNGYDVPPLDSKLNYFKFNYIVFVGSINQRKNLTGLLKAFSILKTKINYNLKLLIIGDQKRIFNQKNTFQNLDTDVVFTGYVEDDVKWAALKGAKLLILPSFLEGFGLPILEAFSVGVPVVASDIQVFHELYGKAIEYVNPDDPEDMARGMKYILEFKNRRRTIILKGYQVLAHFSWGKAACEYDALINQRLDTEAV